MFWTTINRVVDVSLLLLSLTLLVLLWSTTKDMQNTDSFVEKISLYKEETKKMVLNNIQYLESRVNRVQESSDSYQSTMSSRVTVLEEKIEKLEKDNKFSSRITNNNINTNNVNKE